MSTKDYNLKRRYVRALKKIPQIKKVLKEIKGSSIDNQIAVLDDKWNKQGRP